jgi:micrococcal nuclease
VVERVVDGDTVRVRAAAESERVRLLGIDAPELARPGAPAECFGPQASRAAARLLRPGTQVRLEGDPAQDARDRFGRLLAYVYRPGDQPGRPVNALLVAGGYARVYRDGRRPTLQSERLRRAEARARSARAGLWGACRRDG